MSSNADSGPRLDESEDRNQVSITLPPPIVEAVDNHLVETIGTSRSDAIKTALAIYLTENGLLDLEEALEVER